MALNLILVMFFLGDHICEEGEKGESAIFPFFMLERYGTTMLIPPIFPFLPTYSDFTRGELKIGRSLQRNCLSSPMCF